ncbi:MAG: hypothetical protein NVSMB1_11410 [Polyangiales bacterium]
MSHSATPAIHYWKTRCESPPGDPRKAAITTVVRAIDDDTLVLSETAHYTTTMASGDCSADFERSRTFKIVSREGESAGPLASASKEGGGPVSAPSPTLPDPLRAAPLCVVLGEPSALEVRPKRKIIRPGEQFDFKARVLDAKGCELSSTVTFRLAPESSSLAEKISVAASGRVKISADAEPMNASLVVEAASKVARVQLEVVTDQRYADLLGTSGLDRAGADDQATSVVVSNGLGDTIVSGSPLDPPVEEGARRRVAYIAISFGFVTLLSIVGFLLWRRDETARPKLALGAQGSGGLGHREQAEERDERQRELSERPRGDPEDAKAAFAHQGEREEGKREGEQREGRACPRCGAGVPSDAEFCPHDGAPLGASRAAAPAAIAKQEAMSLPRRICPVCGKRYGRDSAFCGKDGVELVPLN